MPKMKNDPNLSAARLRQVWAYDPATGVFTRKERQRGGSPSVTGEAGSLLPAGYRVISVDGTHYFAHRLAWLYVNGEWPARAVLHKNGVRSDNRIDNLALRPLAFSKEAQVPLTIKRLKQVLDYDEATGDFRWKVRTPRTNVGDVAGVISTTGYRYMSVDGAKFLAHRLAWFYVLGRWPQSQIDHINGDPADNRIANLREATNAQNGHNAKVGRRNTTGFKGVSRHRSGRFLARITVNYHVIPLGLFGTAEEAAAAYQAAAEKHHGEFARKPPP